MTDEATAPSLFFRVGGMQFFERLVDAFYDGVAGDDVLARLYPEYPDFTGARHRLTLFLSQYWGGPHTYMEERGHPRLRMRHFPFHVGPLERDHWLTHMAAAVERTCSESALEPGEAVAVATELMEYFVPAAEHLRNDTGLPITSASYPAMTAIAVGDLRKSYGSHAAVAGVSFEVAEGEVYALLGHNGAGKSTIIEILEGHRTRTSGDVSVLGVDPGSAGREFRDRIGIVLQSSGIESELTVNEAVDLYGSAYRRRRTAADAINLVGLDDSADSRVGTLSGGQRRRLDLALGIVGHPELLFLDEPTTGFDPAARRKAWELVAELCRAGTTVLLTTHYLDEAEHLADRVGVLAHGKLVAEGTPAELIGDRGVATVAFDVPDPAVMMGAVPSDASVAGRRISFATRDVTRDLHAVTAWAIAHGVSLDTLTVTRPSLEDVFLQLADAPDADSEPAS